MPVENQIQVKILNFYNDICNQSESCLEKQLARRQLSVKTMNSNSWFIYVQQLLLLYDLESATYYLDNPLSKAEWTKLIKTKIQHSVKHKISTLVPLYSGLKYIDTTEYLPGKIHPLLKLKCISAREVTRIPVKLKMLTGTYILQPLRARIYRDVQSELCIACNKETETLEHILLHCTSLDYIRTQVLRDINITLMEKVSTNWCQLSTTSQMQLLLDITKLKRDMKMDLETTTTLEFHTRRLLFLLHSARSRHIEATTAKKN